MKIYRPKISIIIPTYHQGMFIEETILSILKQEYKNFEIIVIDGGSTDETLNIIKKYTHEIFYAISEKDSGQSEAINKGLKIATGDIITWLNSDDLHEKDAVQTVVEIFIKNPDLDIIHGKSRLFGERIKSQVIGLNADIKLHEYLSYMRFPQPSCFLKKEFLGPTCFVRPDLHYAMDFELIVRALLSGAKIKRVDNLFSAYRMHANSKSNNEIRFLEEWAEIVHCIFLSQMNGRSFAEKMETLQLTKKSTRFIFNSKIKFLELQLENVLLQHLNLTYHSHYRLAHGEQCKSISNFLEQNYNDFYLKNNYQTYNFRLKFIPRFVFEFIRKIIG